MATLGTVTAVDATGVFVLLPGGKGAVRGPHQSLQNVSVGDKVLVVTTDEGDNVIVGLAAVSGDGPLAMAGTGGPAGITAPVGSTWRQTDANSSHGSLAGLLWTKVGTGTVEGTDWLVDFEGRWVAYTPAWTATGGTPTIGDGTLTGVYTRTGRRVSFRVRFVFGSTTSVGSTTDWRFGAPISVANAGTISGYSYYAGWGYAVLVGLLTSGTGGIRGMTGALPATFVGASVPHAWAANDILTYNGTYEIA